MRIVRFNLFWKSSPFIVLLLLLIGLFIPMGWGAPSGPVIIGRQSVAIVPDVAGEVIDVPIQPNVPIKAGDVLFRIDPIPFAAQLKTLLAQLSFAQLRYSQMSELQASAAGRLFDVQQRESEVKQLEGQVSVAQWNLDKTTVRAPADGYVTNLVLRKGARVSNLSIAPVMSFVDTSSTIAVAEIPQIDAHYIEPGQDVELTFKYFPGQVLIGKAQAVLQAIASGLEQPSGKAATARPFTADSFLVRVTLNDVATANMLPAGTVGTAAIFTSRVIASHIIRKVLLRQEAILNYISPY